MCSDREVGRREAASGLGVCVPDGKVQIISFPSAAVMVHHFSPFSPC